MTPQTLLLCQINPSFIQAGRVTPLAFRERDGRMSHRHTYGLTGTHCVHIIHRNTPAMPLNDAHSGGFFTSGAYR